MRGLTLSGEQRTAFDHATEGKDLGVVIGYAGTGKSAMLGVAREPPPAGVEPPPQPLPTGEGLFGRVWINGSQYFAGVSDTAWQFHIGGYQPAQKWLKDRKGRALGWDDVRHYQKIIKILNETGRIMRGIVLPLD